MLKLKNSHMEKETSSMKKASFFLFLILLLAACGDQEEGIAEEPAEESSPSPALEAEVEEHAEDVTIDAYLASEELAADGYVSVLIVGKNHGDEEIAIDPGDFTLLNVEDSAEIGATTYHSGREVPIVAEELILAPGEEGYTFGYFDVASVKPLISAIHTDEYVLNYWGDIELENSRITLSLDRPAEYEEQIAALINENEIAKSDENPILKGLSITVYGPLDDEDAYVRVENTSDEVIYYDADQLYVFDNVATYGVDPKVTDSAFDPTMHLEPGQIVDYREFFILENDLDQDNSEIAENIHGVVYYAPDNGPIINGTLSHEDNLPHDFLEYE
ncbi:MAG TPA: hypothetical protein VK057_05985 [Bacillota bacterium]|nr:hypothetical protein [Bacillota bacterium]